MHHAARYAAGGNDISKGEGRDEAEIRDLARARLPADVHMNLHAYPSHEWTRPLSGYIPRGFGEWTIPKGFFLVLRHHAGHEALAERVLQAGLAALAGFPELVAQNAAMLRRYRAYVGEAAFELHAGAIPFTRAVKDDEPYPVVLITEAPDETVYGESFRLAHEAQFRVVLGVARALRQ